MIVDGTDREGQTVCQGEILKVMIAKNFDHTTVVTLKVRDQSRQRALPGAYLPDADHTDIESGTRKGTGRQ